MKVIDQLLTIVLKVSLQRGLHKMAQSGRGSDCHSDNS